MAAEKLTIYFFPLFFFVWALSKTFCRWENLTTQGQVKSGLRATSITNQKSTDTTLLPRQEMLFISKVEDDEEMPFTLDTHLTINRLPN